jgi:hypothetical protein
MARATKCEEYTVLPQICQFLTMIHKWLQHYYYPHNPPDLEEYALYLD